MPNDYFVDGNVHLLESFDIRRGGVFAVLSTFLKKWQSVCRQQTARSGCLSGYIQYNIRSQNGFVSTDYQFEMCCTDKFLN